MLDGLKERISKSAKIHQSVGIIAPMNNYQDLVDAIFNEMLNSKDEFWIYITITRSFDTIKKQHKNLQDHKNIKFIDCISRASGISTIEPNCIFIESPVMLEKTILEMLNVLHHVKEDVKKYIVIDSLNSLMIYNNPKTVKAFFQHLINKTRAEDIHTISISIEEELDDYLKKIIYFNDKIIKVRESFI